MQNTRIAHYLYTASLFFLILLTGLCIAISAADIIIQALADRTESGTFDYNNLIVVAASYMLLAVVSLSFSCSRVMTVRASLQDIPKVYMPIKGDDLPKKVYTHIQSQFEDVQRIRTKAEPRPEDINQVGWAKPGSMNFEGVDFKRAIAKTPIIIEQAAMQINEQYARPTFLPVRQYIEFLIQQTLIDPELGHGYIEGYEIARFSTAPVSQEKYYDTMKHLAAILHHMGYRLHAVQPKQPNNSSSSAKDGDGDVIPSASSPGVTTAQRQWSDTNQQGRREPRDDDVASLAQSVATWTSRSTQSRHIRSRRSRLRSEQPEDDDEVSYDDECYEDYKQHLQQVIYSRLMWNPSPKYK